MEQTPNNFSLATPLEKAHEMASILYEKQGFDLELYHVEGTTVICDYVLLVTGRSSTHVKALAEELEYEMDRRSVPVTRVEGRAGAAWVLLDYGTVIVHVFDRTAREYYRLDRLYAPETRVPLPTDTKED